MRGLRHASGVMVECRPVGSAGQATGHRLPAAGDSGRRQSAIRRQLFNQAKDLTSDQLAGSAYLGRRVRVDEVKVAADQRERLQLGAGTGGDRKKSGEIPVGGPSGAFGDVGTDRDHRTAHLGSQSVSLFVREVGGAEVDGSAQAVGLLPDSKALEISHFANYDVTRLVCEPASTRADGRWPMADGGLFDRSSSSQAVTGDGRRWTGDGRRRAGDRS